MVPEKMTPAGLKWQDRVLRWQRSGMTANAFALKEGLSPRSLTWWRWRLGHQTGNSGQQPAFVQIEISSMEPRSKAIEILVSDKRVVRAQPGFDAETLLRVVETLEGRA